MNQTSRRRFISIIPVAGAALLMSGQVLAEATKAVARPSNMLDEKSKEAVAVAYSEDAAKGDKVKLKNVPVGGDCSNCGLFQGKKGDVYGGCRLFAGKNVTEKGVCSAYLTINP